MQISPVRANAYVSKLLIPLLPTNFIKTANIKSKIKTARILTKDLKQQTLNIY